MATYGYLAHYGVQGMKWGVRNYQNPDGSLTDAGKRRYYNSDGSLTKKGIKEIPNKNYSSRQMRRDKSIYGEKGVKRINAELNKGNMISGARSLEAKRVETREKTSKNVKRAIKIGAATTAIAVTALYAYPPTRKAITGLVSKGMNSAYNAYDKMKESKAAKGRSFTNESMVFNKTTGMYEFKDL